MMDENLFNIEGPRQRVVGTGLIALDIIINGDPEFNPQLKAGGSCGNVLTILSYLGWKSYPIARFREDSAARIVIEDMRKWGVDTSLITQDSGGSTPIIIEKIKKNQSGEPIHRFTLKCPNCDSFLPGYRPVLAKDVSTIIKKLPTHNVFYFDRVSRSSIEIARASKKNGSLVFFEPRGVKDKKRFLECLKLSDIVKYSHENIRHSEKILQKADIPLEIETLGSDGLRFCFRKSKSDKANWRHMQAYPVHGLKDTAGAGDWCSAGIIHLLGREGAKAFETIDKSAITETLRFGQALAAVSFQFEGPRGIMYRISKTMFQALVRDLGNKGRALESIEEKIPERGTPKMVCFCPDCHKHLTNSKDS